MISNETIIRCDECGNGFDWLGYHPCDADEYRGYFNEEFECRWRHIDGKDYCGDCLDQKASK